MLLSATIRVCAAASPSACRHPLTKQPAFYFRSILRSPSYLTRDGYTGIRRSCGKDLDSLGEAGTESGVWLAWRNAVGRGVVRVCGSVRGGAAGLYLYEEVVFGEMIYCGRYFFVCACFEGSKGKLTCTLEHDPSESRNAWSMVRIP